MKNRGRSIPLDRGAYHNKEIKALLAFPYSMENLFLKQAVFKNFQQRLLTQAKRFLAFFYCNCFLVSEHCSVNMTK